MRSYRAREDINKDSPAKISFNDMIIKAASLACRDVPDVNSQWHGSTIKSFKNADISVAVDIGDGLITPIITNANNRGLLDISSTMKELVDRAKTEQLKPQEYQVVELPCLRTRANSSREEPSRCQT